MMQFDLPKEEHSIIKVFGVGGGGSNAVNHMYRQGISGVEFYVCNTDQQALDISPIPNKVQLGMNLTSGRGAGSVSEVGKEAALENLEEIKEILSRDTKMLFITAGMGGGTGTGAAPIIAEAAKEMGILTVGIVTYPFAFEGRKRSKQADDGMEELRASVDTLLIICNDKLREIYGNLSLKNAFAKADDILTVAAKGIAEIITVTGYINVDFEDVRTVMTNSGVAIMGSAAAEGENRAILAVQEALASPLLNDNNIEGANYILLNITSGEDEVLMDEITEITDYIQDEAGLTADIIWGSGTDEGLGDRICVTLIATGFSNSKEVGGNELGQQQQTKVVHKLSNEYKKVNTEEQLASASKELVQEKKPAEELPLAWNEQQLKGNKSQDKVIRYNLYDETPSSETVPSSESSGIPSSASSPDQLPTSLSDSLPEIDSSENSLPSKQENISMDTAPRELESSIEPVNETINQQEIQRQSTNVTPFSQGHNPAENDFSASQQNDASEQDSSQNMPEWNSGSSDSGDHTTLDETPSNQINGEDDAGNQWKQKEEEEPGFSFSKNQETELTEEPNESIQKQSGHQDATFAQELDQEENLKRSQERIAQLKHMSMKMQSPSGIADLEDQPAYVRRNIKLTDVTPSSSTEQSRYALGKDDEDQTSLRSNNSFLHDNVD